MAKTTFQGPVRSLNGFISQGPGMVVTAGATLTLTTDTHGGRIVLCPATCAITLPTIVTTSNGSASGPGSDPNNLNNLGVVFTLYWTAAAANTTTQTVTCGGSDKYIGGVLVSGTTTMAFASTTNTIITLNKTTSGGAAAGSMIQLVAVAANTWAVSGLLIGSGTVATPFS